MYQKPKIGKVFNSPSPAKKFFAQSQDAVNLANQNQTPQRFSLTSDGANRKSAAEMAGYASSQKFQTSKLNITPKKMIPLKHIKFGQKG